MRARLALLLLAVLAAGCGSTTGEDRPGAEATLLLDFTPERRARRASTWRPSAATTRRRGSSSRSASRARRPTRSSCSRPGARTWRSSTSTTSGSRARRGSDIVGVMAFVQRPLAAVLAQPSIRSPADLEGERAGVSGLPSDEAVLRSVVAGDGGDPDEGPHDHDRVPGRQGAAGGPRRRRDGVLERRGRRAARAAARRSASSASTTSARRPTRSWCCA